MPNQSRSSWEMDDQDDLALPGETLDEDEQLRMEVNVDRELWNRYLSTETTPKLKYGLMEVPNPAP